MGFVTKTWKDPVNIDSNNLNRIEQGIKNSHDTLEILEEEVSNLQTKQLDILEQLKTSTPNISSDTILEQLNSILGDTEILTALKNANSFLTKSAQELTKSELNQVYKNLDLDRMLKLTDIRVNDTSVVQGSIASITLPKVDKTLNLNSNNAISNSAVVRAINKLIKNIENNTTFYLKDAIEDDGHMTVSRDEIVRWNSINVDSFLTEESDPTVPAWAKASTKPIYTYNEILGTPTIPTDNIELENGRGYITSSEASTIASNLLNTFQTNTINPLSSRVTNLEAMDVTITNALNNKADANHTHSNLASITWVTEEIEDKIAELVGSAPATLDTIQELAAALNNNADIIDTINSTIANKATIKFGNTIQTTVTFDSDPQIQIDNKFDKTGGTITGDTNIVNGQGLVLTPASAGSTYYAFKFYAQGDDVFVEKQKVEGGADYQKLLPLDSSLSTTSENAVQNKAITQELNKKINASDLLNKIYPIGSIYMSVNSTNPSALFGGTWEQFAQGRVLLGVGSNGETDYTTAEQTGGSENSVASHTHTQQEHNHTQPVHKHALLSNTKRDGNANGFGANNKIYGISGVWQNSAPASQYYNVDNAGLSYVKGTRAINNPTTAVNNSTGEVGGNRMPFITCYIWKRIA